MERQNWAPETMCWEAVCLKSTNIKERENSNWDICLCVFSFNLKECKMAASTLWRSTMILNIMAIFRKELDERLGTLFIFENHDRVWKLVLPKVLLKNWFFVMFWWWQVEIVSCNLLWGICQKEFFVISIFLLSYPQFQIWFECKINSTVLGKRQSYRNFSYWRQEYQYYLRLTLIPEQNTVRIFELLFAWNSKWLLNFLLLWHFLHWHHYLVLNHESYGSKEFPKFVKISEFTNSSASSWLSVWWKSVWL